MLAAIAAAVSTTSAFRLTSGGGAGLSGGLPFAGGGGEALGAGWGVTAATSGGAAPANATGAVVLGATVTAAGVGPAEGAS
jgi:hypothetical protein